MNFELYSYPGYPAKLQGRDQPDVRPIARRQYILNKSYFVTLVDEERNYYRLDIPKGFKHDGASVPRLAWTLSGLTPDGLLRAAALVHDYFYRKVGWMVLENVQTKKMTVLKVDRKSADDIFLKLMLAAGVSRYRANVAHRFVRMFGPRF